MNYEYFISLTKLTKKVANDLFRQEKLVNIGLRDSNNKKIYSDADHCVLADI